MVLGIVHWYALRPLVPIRDHLNAVPYLSIVTDYVSQLVTTVKPCSGGHFHVGSRTVSQRKLVSDWFMKHNESSLRNHLHNHLISIP